MNSGSQAQLHKHAACIDLATSRGQVVGKIGLRSVICAIFVSSMRSGSEGNRVTDETGEYRSNYFATLPDAVHVSTSSRRRLRRRPFETWSSPKSGTGNTWTASNDRNLRKRLGCYH
jgi:hypothetical protein